MLTSVVNKREGKFYKFYLQVVVILLIFLLEVYVLRIMMIYRYGLEFRNKS